MTFTPSQQYKNIMESFADKLRTLTTKKYFAIISVIFFAFITALIFALISQQKTTPTTDALRLEIKMESTPIRKSP